MRISDADKLVTNAEYGQHIPLMCLAHPELRWTTKNIAPIGARHIFYVSPDKGPECRCHASLLRPVKS